MQKDSTQFAMGTCFSHPVTDFLGYAQVLLVTLYCFLQVREKCITTSEAAIGMSLSIPVTDFLGIAQASQVVLHCSWLVAEGFINVAYV